jgi:hypothetical protein
LLHGIDQESQSAWVDVICDENPDYRAEDDSRGHYRVEHKMRTMNYYRRLGKPVWTGYRDEESLAFNLTFTGNPGINHAWGYAEPGRKSLNAPQPGVGELLNHYRRHIHLYTRVASHARTAVWRGRQSLAYVSTDTHLSACVMEQLLFSNRIPFSIVTDGFICEAKLRDFDLMILPDVEFIGQPQVDALTRFVECGGSLLITECSGQYTAEPRRRRQSAFAHLFHLALKSSLGEEVEAATIDPHAQFTTQSETGEPAFACFGRGRVAYLPRIDYIYPPRTFKSHYNVFYDGIDSRYWKPPQNAGEILSIIRWLYPTCQPVEAYGSPELRLDYVRWPDGTRGVQLVRCGPLRAARDIPLCVIAETEPRQGRLFKPEQADPLKLEWRRRGDRFETLLPRVMRHAVVTYR